MEEKIPELRDVNEMVNRFNATHPEGIFVFQFLGFKKDPEHQRCDCGGDCDVIDENKSLTGMYGHIEGIRTILNDLRDIAEDNIDEDGFVNVSDIDGYEEENIGEDDGRED